MPRGCAANIAGNSLKPFKTVSTQEEQKTVRRQTGAKQDHAWNTPLTKQLTSWRRDFKIDMARVQNTTKINSSSGEWTVAILGSGGCLDTLSAIRAGVTAVWGSEIDPEQQKMFVDLTGGICMGDTFGPTIESASRVRYLKSGQPCTDYSRSGKHRGASGNTGWMFVKQTDVILRVQP